jgi:hypothetical protein
VPKCTCQERVDTRAWLTHLPEGKKDDGFDNKELQNGLVRTMVTATRGEQIAAFVSAAFVSLIVVGLGISSQEMETYAKRSRVAV